MLCPSSTIIERRAGGKMTPGARKPTLITSAQDRSNNAEVDAMGATMPDTLLFRAGIHFCSDQIALRQPGLSSQSHRINHSRPLTSRRNSENFVVPVNNSQDRFKYSFWTQDVEFSFCPKGHDVPRASRRAESACRPPSE